MADSQLNPLFYFLAKFGPWKHHVKINRSSIYTEIADWLINSGYTVETDWEVVVFQRSSVDLNIIVFFNDTALASYVKLTWG